MDFILFVISVTSLVVAWRTRGRVKDLDGKAQNLRNEIERLHKRISEVRAEVRATPAGPPAVAVAAASEAGPFPSEPPPIPVPPPPPPIPSSIPIVDPIVFARSVAPQPSTPPPPVPPSPFLGVDAQAPAIRASVEPPPFDVPLPRADVVSEPVPSHAADSTVPPPIPPAEPAPPPPPPAKPFDWEGFLGVKLLSWVAGILLAFAGIYFAKVAVASGWLSPALRLTILLVLGIGLLVGGELKKARRYAVTANALDGGGIVVLYAALFAAHSTWHLLDAIPTFVAMAIVTAVAVALAIRHDAVFIAALGLFGGFATPALLSTGQDRPIGLFGYLLLLNVGLAWTAHRKRWAFLSVLCVAFTALYQWAWVAKFLTEGKLSLAVGIFLVFPVLAVASFALGEREPGDKTELFRKAAAASAALPLLFAFYLSAVKSYGERYGILFGFLFVLCLGLSVVAATQGPGFLHLLGGLSAVMVFGLWLANGYTDAAWPAVLLIAPAFIALYALADMAVTKAGRSFGDLGRRGVYAAPLLVFVFPAVALLEPLAASPGTLFGILFAVLAGLSAFAVLKGEGAVHFLACFFALAAEAIWSAKHLTAERLIPALAIYGVFALFYLGVPVVARRYGKALRPEGSGALLLFVSLGLLFFLAAGTVAQAALWGIALLLVILNLGLLFEAASGRNPVLCVLGMVVSWVVLAVWWATASLVTMFVPGLVVVGGFALLVTGGNAWLKGRETTATSRPDPGIYLGLVGHVFLLFVVGQKSLGMRPWPILGVLAVLALALGVAALYARRGALHAAALVASQVVLLVWAGTVEVAPWPTVAILFAAGISIFGLAWVALARRVGVGGPFAGGAAASLFLLQLLVILSDELRGAPGYALQTSAIVASLVALLALAHFGRPWWSVLAVFSTTFAVWHFQLRHVEKGAVEWEKELLLAGLVYAAFLVNPVVLGAKAKRPPYVAAVLASVSFFLLARVALVSGGLGEVIGILPITQALLLAALLWRLRQIEGPGPAVDTGRLALVAGAALGFITVAIPLQLDKQWITIGWAALVAAYGWLYQRVKHRGVLHFATGLAVAVFVRLVLNPAVLQYHPRGGTPIVNWYLYGYGLPAAAFFVAAWLFKKTDEIVFWKPRLSTLLQIGATVILFLLVNIEIADFFSTGATLTFNFDSASLAEDLSYTLGWAVFAIGLLVAGLVNKRRAVRISALVLFCVALLKGGFHDLWRLGGLYRVGSLFGLAVGATVIAVLMKKFVLGVEEKPK